MENWQTFKIGELFDFIPTGSHSRDAMTYGPVVSPIYNIHYGDIHTKYDGYIDLSNDVVPALKASDGVREVMMLHKGDIIVADASEDYAGVGNAVEIINTDNKKCIAGLHTFALRGKPGSIALGYGALIFRHAGVHRRLMQVATYSKVYGVTKASLNEIAVSLPPFDDQIRIVELLKNWDQYINNVRAKIKVSQNVRKALINNIFTDQSSNNSDTTNSKKIKLSEIVEFRNGKPFESAIDTNGDYDLITIDSIDINGHLKKKHKKVNKTDESLKKGDLVMVLSDIAHGLLLGLSDVVPEDGKYVLNQRMGRLRLKTNDLPEFVRLSINANQLHFRKRAQGTSQRHIYERDVMALEIYLPSYEEQLRISNLLTTIDTEISLLLAKERIITQQKLYLQDGLVTGKIPVPKNTKVIVEPVYA